MNVPFLIQTRGMAAKAAVETMTKAFTEAVLENPSRTITAAAGVIVWALGTTVAVNRESVQKQLDRDSEAEQRQQDRDSQAEQRQQSGTDIHKKL